MPGDVNSKVADEYVVLPNFKNNKSKNSNWKNISHQIRTFVFFSYLNFDLQEAVAGDCTSTEEDAEEPAEENPVDSGRQQNYKNEKMQIYNNIVVQNQFIV